MLGPLPAAPGCDCHICRPDDSYDDLDRNAIDTVLRHGWQVILVSDDVECSSPDHDADDHEHASSAPAFAYTLGLGHRCGHPELLMSGLDPHLMHRALNDVAGRVMAGRRLAPGDVLEGVLAGVPVTVERVAADALDETLRWSGWFHRREPEALMIVWPSTSGLFGWQPGAPEVLDELQPRSWREPVEHRGGLAADPDWPFPVPPDRMVFSCTHVVDEGDSVLWVARQSDPETGEDWSLRCGAAHHSTDDMRMLHLAHLVRAAPSVRSLAGLPLDHEAWRDDVESAWQTRALA
ncbi:MAG: DUF4262 domain-containing protein [Nocardioides sp.]